VGAQYQLIMDTHIQIFEDTSKYLIALVDYIDRTKTTMITTYPNWDDWDTAEFKTLAIDRLNLAIAKLNQL
jgi:hypothetical protein